MLHGVAFLFKLPILTFKISDLIFFSTNEQQADSKAVGALKIIHFILLLCEILG